MAAPPQVTETVYWLPIGRFSVVDVAVPVNAVLAGPPFTDSDTVYVELALHVPGVHDTR